MRTVLVTGHRDLPDALRELVERGSTSLEERDPAELASESSLDHIDRIVFWTAASDPRLLDLVERFARAEAAERRQVVVFVAGDDSAVPQSTLLAPNEVFVWPRDEDRLTLAFLTGG